MSSTYDANEIITSLGEWIYGADETESDQQLLKDAVRLIKQLQQQVERECVWTKTVMGIYGEYDNWATSCGEDFAITEEWHEKPTPFCSNCGGKAVIVIGAR